MMPERPEPPSTQKALPRYKRASEAPAMLLQERDLAMVEDVWRYRCLTTSQLETLRLADPDPARRFVSRLPLTRRLKLLFHHRYLQRIPRPTVGGSLEPVYVLDREGARVLSLRYGEVKSKAPSQQPKPAALDHLLAIAQTQVALAAACASRNDVELVEWRRSDEVKFRVTVNRVTTSEGERAKPVTEKPVTLIPDGFVMLRSGGRKLFFFVEVDLGTEPQKTLTEKAQAYYAYWKNGGFAQDYGVPAHLAFRVLLIVPTANRLQVALKAVGKLAKGHGLFWMALENEIVPASVLGESWLTTDSEERKALLK